MHQIFWVNRPIIVVCGFRDPPQHGGRKGNDMNVLDDYMVDPRLSLLDKTRIQAQVLVPVLRALRSEIGKEKADAIVRRALRDWSKALFAEVGKNVGGGPRRQWAAMQTALTEITEREVTVQMNRHDKDALEFDIVSCKFAEFFRALGEPELGALLICATDFDIAAAGSGAVSLTRADIDAGCAKLHVPLRLYTAGMISSVTPPRPLAPPFPARPHRTRCLRSPSARRR
jgi:hypothetical protein